MRLTVGGVGVFLAVTAVGAVLWYSPDLTTDSVEKPAAQVAVSVEIGRASCRERVLNLV